MSSAFPVAFQYRHQALKADVEVVLNWLDVEIEKDAEKRLPTLAQLSGHRRREVIAYIESYDWTARIYE